MSPLFFYIMQDNIEYILFIEELNGILLSHGISHIGSNN